MSIFLLKFPVFLAGIASMVAAYQRGDLDEVARQGAEAGPAVVEQGLRSTSRIEVLAAIAATRSVEDRLELLPALARVAESPDRRLAIPAARAALELATAMHDRDLPDDLAGAEVEDWRARFEQVGRARAVPVEVRVLAFETAHALAIVGDPTALGFDRASVEADGDPAIRALARALAP